MVTDASITDRYYDANHSMTTVFRCRNLNCIYIRSAPFNLSFLNLVNEKDKIAGMYPGFPPQTGKPGKMDKLFPVREKSGNFVQTGKVREIWTKYWKSRKFREFQFFVLFLIELYLLKWIKFAVFRPTLWVSLVVIQFGESWCPTACTCSPSTDSILGLLLTSYTIWIGWP